MLALLRVLQLSGLVGLHAAAGSASSSLVSGGGSSVHHHRRRAQMMADGPRRFKIAPPADSGAAPPAPGSDGVWYVADFGAKGDNASDATPHFAAALAACAAAHGGEVVAPAGLYRFEGNLSVPEGCCLSGSYKSVPGDPLGTPPSGTVLMPTGGRGTSCDVPLTSPNNGVPCSDAFITLAADATVRGSIIFYPEQETKARPVPYPWSIFMAGDNSGVTDLECLNCWNAIAAVGAGRHYIAVSDATVL